MTVCVFTYPYQLCKTNLVTKARHIFLHVLDLLRTFEIWAFPSKPLCRKYSFSVLLRKKSPPKFGSLKKNKHLLLLSNL